MDQAILRHALQNALKYSGRASADAIIGKILKETPERKSDLKALQKEVLEAVETVNRMGRDEKEHSLAELGVPGVKKTERDIFGFMDIKGRVVSAFPPGPEKYPHIGHAKALILNHMLARRHLGRFILRFEDTNPVLVEEKFYSIMQDDFRWLGVDWDELVYASDHMELFYRHAQALIEKGLAYVCTCSPDTASKNRQKGVACSCRAGSTQENVNEYARFRALAPGQAVVRLKIDMAHKNSTMRDPAILRIIDKPHARQHQKYRVWPTYDFQNAIMDGEGKVTHRLRSKEFEMRSELQRHIQKILGYSQTEIFEFARFNLQGVPSSGRLIREMIGKGELLGWDDPSLATLAALRRRGFLPEAIREFVVSTGISKAESTLTWDDLYVWNRRLLDKSAARYFFVADPVRIIVENAPFIRARLRLHPEQPDKGERILECRGAFYIGRKDYETLEEGRLYRLMDCLNFVREKGKFIFHSSEYSRFRGEGHLILHYLPVSDSLARAEILMPDKTLVSGLAEPLVKDLTHGEIVQFERFGFCRLDEKSEDSLKFYFAHK